MSQSEVICITAYGKFFTGVTPFNERKWRLKIWRSRSGAARQRLLAPTSSTTTILLNLCVKNCGFVHFRRCFSISELLPSLLKSNSALARLTCTTSKFSFAESILIKGSNYSTNSNVHKLLQTSQKAPVH